MFAFSINIWLECIKWVSQNTEQNSVYEWLSCFEEGERAIENEHRLGRSSIARNDRNLERMRLLIYRERKRYLTAHPDCLQQS